MLILRNARRIACLAAIAGGCSIAAAHTTDEIYAAHPALRRFVDTQHGEALAIEAGRAEIDVNGHRIALERTGVEWLVTSK